MEWAAGRQIASWSLIGGLGLAVVVQPLGCGGTDPSTDEDPLVGELLAAVGPQVVQPALADALADAQALQQAIDAWEAEAAGSVESEQARADAAEAWRDLAESWQEVEVMQLGPLGSSATAIGGQDGRDRVYSWPVVNPCRVDQETGRESFAEPDWADTALVNVIGIDALEHLLLAGPDNTCPAQVDINAEGLWDDLGPDGVEDARARYAVVVADLLVSDLQAQVDAWEAFGPELAAAGSDGNPYETQADGLNAVFDALFYLETGTKDRKLAVPLGLRECSDDVCPDQAEHTLSGESLTALRANLDGFEALFTGGEGTGMDDVLRDRGHGDLADRVLADLEQARTELDVLELPIDQAVVESKDQTQAVHDAIKQTADDLKGDIATVLSMRIPAEAAGDND